MIVSVRDMQMRMRAEGDDAVFEALIISAESILHAHHVAPTFDNVTRLVAHWYDMRGISRIGGVTPLFPVGFIKKEVRNV